jgi:hypothetical protein
MVSSTTKSLVYELLGMSGSASCSALRWSMFFRRKRASCCAETAIPASRWASRAHARVTVHLPGLALNKSSDDPYYDPVINASYAALIKHYETAVVPARVRRPKDKPSVE